FGDLDLVQIARLGVVDRRPLAVAQIFDRASGRHGRWLRQRGELRARVGVEVGLEAGGGDDSPGRRLNVEVVVLPAVSVMAAVRALVPVTHRSPGEVNWRD